MNILNEGMIMTQEIHSKFIKTSNLEFSVEIFSDCCYMITSRTENNEIFEVFNADSEEEMNEKIFFLEKRAKIQEVLESFKTEMEGYSYYGSNPGIPEDSFDEVAKMIIEKMGI